ncbi:MAG: glycosyltransferase [Holophagales bacterium]|nr:glycosyltransferase [Holophagales bacterium]
MTGTKAGAPAARRLLVVSHTPHHLDDDRVVGFGPTVRELDHLARLFEHVVHLAPLHPGPAPASSRPYAAANLSLRPLKPAGGPALRHKLGILLRYPGYGKALLTEARQADLIHVRAPANVALLAILALLPGYRRWWVKYAGNWRPEPGGVSVEPRSYTLQRRLLSMAWPRLAVTVAGNWPSQPRHVVSFHNPCLTRDELEAARRETRGKRLEGGPRLLFAGNLDANKGADRALRIAAYLRQRTGDSAASRARLDVAGDGPERQSLEALSGRLGLGDRVTFHGALPRQELDQLYRRAHLLLVPSGTEGWPKVIGEAMAWGVVPLASAVSSIPQILGGMEVGRTLPPTDVDAFAGAALSYLRSPDTWTRESQRAAAAAELLTYDRYESAVRELLKNRWKLPTPEES